MRLAESIRYIDMQRVISALEHRIAAIEDLLSLRDKLPEDIVQDCEAKLDELETFLAYVKSLTQ